MLYEAEPLRVPKSNNVMTACRSPTRSVGHFSASLNEKGSSTDARRRLRADDGQTETDEHGSRPALPVSFVEIELMLTVDGLLQRAF
jgi:hypothetical protein